MLRPVVRIVLEHLRVLGVQADARSLIADDQAVVLRGLADRSLDSQAEVLTVEASAQKEVGSFRHTVASNIAVGLLGWPGILASARSRNVERERVADLAPAQLPPAHRSRDYGQRRG